MTNKMNNKIWTRPGSQEWHWIAEHLFNLLHPDVGVKTASHTPKDIQRVSPKTKPLHTNYPHLELDTEPVAEWSWCPPNLSEESNFYKARLETKKLLSYHQQNYSPNGPQQLTVLWWEWLKEHWEALSDGSSMNFLINPETVFINKSKMDPNQQKISIKFMDELIKLGILVETRNEDLRNNFPPFLVEKPDQPGQGQCIAAGKKGGQNGACLSDASTLLDHKTYFQGCTQASD